MFGRSIRRHLRKEASAVSRNKHNKICHLRLVVLCVAILPFFNTLAEEAPVRGTDKKITIANPYTLVAPDWLKTRPVYMDIINRGEHKDVLVGVSSPVAESVTMQFSADDGHGYKTMRPLDNQQILLPPKSRVRLQPGGMHLMLENLKQPLELGYEMPLKLEFLHQKPRHIKVIIQKQPN